jgi:hypothetical protein
MRIVSKVAKEFAARADGSSSRGDPIDYLNRDQVVSASIRENELILITILGEEIRIAASGDELAELAEELFDDSQSNFARISRGHASSK